MEAERLHLFGLALVPGLGPKKIRLLIELFGSSQKAWQANPEQLKRVQGIGDKIAGEFCRIREELDLQLEWDRYRQRGIRIITSDDADYPRPLLTIYEPPPVLFCRGDYHPADRMGLAVVGSRRISHYGKKVCRQLVQELVIRGFTIVSGFARGIDTIGHREAIKEGGRTIAVLGSGLDVIYPPENKELYQEVWKHGCILSEYPLGMQPLRQNFPLRNRLISGLSLGTLVIEAAKRSGSLITANWALEQGREVFAVPGDITRMSSAGTNNLIRAGAKIVTCIEDVLEEFPALNFTIREDEGEEETQGSLPFLTEDENMVYQLIDDQPAGIEEIMSKTPFPPGRVNSLLLGLELKGVIQELPGKRYVINS
ncbi:MAG: DNA-processing protein DprA [Halanaerobium sp.]|nr:DNA-processing protein DprA [Halanaerobium sp.]